MCIDNENDSQHYQNMTLEVTVWAVQYMLVAAVASSTITVAVQSPIAQPAPTLAEDIETITVTGSRREIAVSDAVVSTDVLTRDAVEASGAENLAELLEGQPGLQIIRSFSGAGISIQGFDPEYTLILIDGQRVNGRINGIVDLQRLSVENIERVEVVKGAASALWGADALAGVVNIITREGRESFAASVHGAYGSLSTTSQPFDADQTNTIDLSGRIFGSGKRWNASLTAGFHRQDAFDLAPDDLATSGSELTSFNIEARGRYRFSDSTDVLARVEYFERQLEGIDLGPERVEVPNNPFGQNRAVFDRSNRTRTFSASLQPRLEINPNHDLELTAYFTRFNDEFESDQRDQTINDTLQETSDDLGQLNLKYVGSLGTDHIMVAGVEGLYRRLSTPRVRDGLTDRGRISAYAQDEWRPLQGLAVVPGFRVDVDSQFGTFPTPKLAVRYEVIRDVVLRSSYGLGFRAPDPRDQFLIFENPAAGYRVDGNPDLEPETSRNFLVSAEVQPFQHLSFRVEFYRNDITNLIAFVTDSDSDPNSLQMFTNDNIGSAVTQGIEAWVAIRWHSVFRSEVSYTYLDARDEDNDRFLQGRARHRATMTHRLDIRSIGMGGWIRGTVVGQRPFYAADPNDPETDITTIAEEYITADARIFQRIGEHFTVFVGVDNMTNAGDPQFLAIPPFGLYAGLDARL